MKTVKEFQLAVYEEDNHVVLDLGSMRLMLNSGQARQFASAVLGMADEVDKPYANGKVN